MKKNQEKLELAKMKISKLSNMHLIKGGDGQDLKTTGSRHCSKGCDPEEEENNC